MTYQNAEGWQYQIRVFYEGTDPNPSPGGCLDVAPPGQTNVKFRLLVENLITDREAPMADLVFGSNLIGDGGVFPGKPFADDTNEAQHTSVEAEVVPNSADKQCLFARTIGPIYGNIAPGGWSEHVLTVGPVDESRLGDMIVGMRAFADIGMFYPAEFTVEEGSGSVGDLESAFG